MLLQNKAPLKRKRSHRAIASNIETTKFPTSAQASRVNQSNVEKPDRLDGGSGDENGPSKRSDASRANEGGSSGNPSSRDFTPETEPQFIQNELYPNVVLSDFEMCYRLGLDQIDLLRGPIGYMAPGKLPEYTGRFPFSRR